MNNKLVYIIAFFTVLVNVIPLSAQVVSDGGRFEVDYDKGCAPLTININPLGAFVGVRQYDHDGDGLFQSLSSFTFDTPGTYNLLEIIQNEIPREDSITITVLESRKPGFQVFNCASNSVFVSITDTYYDQYEIDYGEGVPIVVNQGDPIAPFSYSTAGTYDVTVRGIFALARNNCADSTITINTVNSLNAGQMNNVSVPVADQNNGQIMLNFNINADITHELEQSLNGVAAWQIIDTLTNSGFLTISDLNTVDNYYCYRIRAVDRCLGNILYSDTICSIKINGTAFNNLNQVNWETTTLNFSNYTVMRDGMNISTINNSATNFYDDVDVNCQQAYCYNIINNYSNGLISTSATTCVTAISNDIPASLEEFSTSIVNGEVIIDWDLPAAFVPEQYFISRSTNGGTYSFLDSTAIIPYPDNTISIPLNEYCYQLVYRDVCQNYSPPSVDTCPVILKGNLNEYDVQLSWTNYIGWINDVNQYFVEILDASGNILNTIAAGVSFNLTDQAEQYNTQILNYRIRAVSNHSTPKEVYSNEYQVILQARLGIPNAFRPSSSNSMNNTFKVFGQFINTFSMKIFNRWGELIFSSTNPDDGWDGSYEGRPLPGGSYIYRVDITDYNGIKTFKTGVVVLLR